MINPEEVKQAARESVDLLGNPVFKKAIADLSDRLNSTLMGCSDQAKQLHLVAQLQALKAIELQIQTYISSGKMLEKRGG